MPTQVIQFGKLEEFVQEELRPGNVVRVVTLDMTESVSSEIAGLRVAGVGVHVRAINDAGQMLACYLPVASIQLFGASPRDSDPGWQEYKAAWETAEALEARVLAYLNQVAAEKGFTVRAAGVIDIGQARPLRATWRSDPVLKERKGDD
ncbi:MAG: hypothetical protein L0332_34280 [Chloroflexi bacterium]|nr:hypothetical protein [Chloroflexota bacterium]MCI0731765.1 hypothetical protein [Chloroflexota bacterium]